MLEHWTINFLTPSYRVELSDNCAKFSKLLTDRERTIQSDRIGKHSLNPSTSTIESFFPFSIESSRLVTTGIINIEARVVAIDLISPRTWLMDPVRVYLTIMALARSSRSHEDYRGLLFKYGLNRFLVSLDDHDLWHEVRGEILLHFHRRIGWNSLQRDLVTRFGFTPTMVSRSIGGETGSLQRRRWFALRVKSYLTHFLRDNWWYKQNG